MVHVDAIFEYRLPGLLIHSDLTGQRLHLPDGLGWIQFPDNDHGIKGGPLFRSDQVIAGWNNARDNTTANALVINGILVGIPMELELDLTSPREERVRKAINEASPQARAIFVGLTDWLRVNRSYAWLNSKTSLASSREVAAALFDSKGKQLDFGHVITTGGSGKVTVLRELQTYLITELSKLGVRGSDHALESRDAEKILRLVANGEEPPLWDLFLADAYSPVGLHYSVVLAAASCEAAVKTALSNAAGPEQEILVELLLNNPHDYSLAASRLFDDPCKAVLGRSLKEDNAELYNRIKRLFRDRNRIVHRMLADISGPNDLQDNVVAAGKAIDWLTKSS